MYTLRDELSRALAREAYADAAAAQAELTRLRAARPQLLWRDELLILSAGGKELHLVSDAAGAPRTRLLYAAPTGALLQQPIWSPDGERVAVSEVVPSGSTSRVVVLSARDGAEVASAPTPPIFFLYFGPANDVLTFLHPEPNLRVDGPSLVLGALDLKTNEARYVAPGGPLYYALSATAGQMVLHNGFLGEVTYCSSILSGAAQETLCADPASFRAPCLLDSAAAVYVEADGSLVALDLDTRTRACLHTLDRGADALLVASPDGSSLFVLHVRSVAKPGADEPGAMITERELLLIQADSATELANAGAARRVTHTLPVGDKMVPLCAFFSPDSRKLLVLESPLSGTIGASVGPPGGGLRATWSVYELQQVDGGAAPMKRVYDPWMPSSHFLRSIVPFFDQYAQALSPWSPDSSHFCFATADGKVCVQSVEGATASLDASRSALGAQLGMVQLAPDAEVVDAPDADLVVWSPC